VKVLFADDTPDTRMVFQLGLEISGHDVTCVSNGAEAIEAVSKENYDAIVLDIEMPKIDGFMATQSIRQLPGGQQVPIVVLTAYHEPAVAERALAMGANSVVHKPIAASELMVHLEKLIYTSQNYHTPTDPISEQRVDEQPTPVLSSPETSASTPQQASVTAAKRDFSTTREADITQEAGLISSFPATAPATNSSDSQVPSEQIAALSHKLDRVLELLERLVKPEQPR
jgi:CheY-like chemotaxis protein